MVVIVATYLDLETQTEPLYSYVIIIFSET